MNNPSSCALPHRFLCHSGHTTRMKLVHRPFRHTSSPFRLPEVQRLIEVMRHCMWRVSGIPTPLSGALHTVASQHMTTLHNASGRHILCCQPAQVKYPLFAAHFCAPNYALCFQIACALRVFAIRTRSLLQRRTPSFDTEQCAMDFFFPARDHRSNVNTITTNE